MERMTDIPAPGKKKRVVIVGGGFAGLKTARRLDETRFQVVLVDRNNHHIFQPLLYQVATSGIEPSAISFPFRKVFSGRRDVHIRVCTATRVLSAQDRLETDIGYVDYDYLVIATGCDTNYFGDPALAGDTMALKTTAEALYDRNHILESFERALTTDDGERRRELMTFVIVGAGPTGIELAGSLAELRRFVLPKDYPDLDIGFMRIVLADAGKRILSGFSEDSSRKVAQYMDELKVEVLLDNPVKGYRDGVLTFGDGSTIRTENVFWVAGVKANGLEGLPPEAYGHGGRLKVNEYNGLEGCPHVFALGDTALMVTEDHPAGHPQLVQPAIQQARLLVRNLGRLVRGRAPKPFRYRDKGILATIGRNKAVAEIGRIRLSGFPAWAIWLFIHLMNILGVKNRLFVFINWMWSYVTYNQSLRLIIRPVRKGSPENGGGLPAGK